MCLKAVTTGQSPLRISRFLRREISRVSWRGHRASFLYVRVGNLSRLHIARHYLGRHHLEVAGTSPVSAL
jgi:hypothetical protein